MALGKEVDALERGFRSRAMLLGLVLVGGLGAAMWSGTRQTGIGEPELRHRVMVVTEREGIDYYAVLERGGFEVEIDGYDAWVERAREVRGESEAQGVALLLELADLEGVGYVVFEAPGARDFSALELEPALGELDAHDYAVLSVGDLAFPHHASVDAAGDDALVRLPGYGALEALFAQPSLLARVDDALPTIDELQHEARIELGQRMAQRPATFAAALASAHDDITASFALDPGAPPLVPAWTTGSAIFDPEGGVLVISHALDIYSEDGRRLELHPAAAMRFEYLAPADIDAHLAGGAQWRTPPLTPCTSLAEGSVELEREPRLEAAVDGSALAISTRGGSTAIWQRERGPECLWQQVAELDGRMNGSMVLAPASGSQGARLLMAQAGGAGEGAPTLRAWSGGRELDSPQLLEGVDLLSLPEARPGALAFVGAQQLALLSSTPLPAIEQTTTHRANHVIHLVDRRAPGAHLRVPSDFFARGATLLELALAAPAQAPNSEGASATQGSGPAFVLTATQGLGKTELIWLRISASAWAEFVDAAPTEYAELGPLPAGAAPRLYTLTPEDLELRRLPGEPEQARLGLSVSAGRVAYTSVDGADPSEVSWLELGAEQWTPHALTHNGLVDTLPRLSRDGSKLVFMSRVRTELSASPYSVPRVVRLF